MQFHHWTSLRFHVIDVSEETTTSLQKLLMKVYRDAKTSRKRSRPNQPVVKEEPAQPAAVNEELEEIRCAVNKKIQEMKQLAEHNVNLTKEIDTLKRELEAVSATQLYELKISLMFPAT